MNRFKHEILQELINILEFWKSKTVDKSNGGFIGRVDGFNIPHEKASKGIILNARILWTFSAAALYLKSNEEKIYAERSFNYIEHFWDKENGGMFWEISAEGKPLDTKKQIYAQAFAIYALSEYYMLSLNEHAKDQAIKIYHLIEKYSFDPQNNGYLEAFDKNWNLLDDLRLSDKDANEKKTMNTHLHVLEAYTNLYRIWPDNGLKKQLKNLILIFLNKILDLETHHLNLFFDEKWALKSSVYSFGHDIEASWLLQEAAETINDVQLIERAKSIADAICNVVINEGIDVDGSLLNEGRNGSIIDTDKHWWPQAEAMVGFINAWQNNKDETYYEKALDIWNFIKQAVIDKENGEWYYRINRRWQPYFIEDKVGFWKCPYHNSRACLELLYRL